MANPGDFAYTLKQQADIVRIIGDYVKLKKNGAQNYSGLCPFHSEKTASFSVHATRQFFHCFGCGVSGDVFSFVQKIESITFPEAVRAIAQKLGVPLPKATFNSAMEAREASQRTSLLEIHDRACAFFQEFLRRPEAAPAREYLSGRGLDEATIKAFRIGFAPDSGFILRDRLKNDFSEDILRESGLFSWKESAPVAEDQRPAPAPTTNDQRPTALYSKFRNRIMFPIANEAGRIIAFTGRTLSTDEKAGPKYLNSPETAIYSKSRVLFNLDLAKEAIRKLDYAILVEGQMDCISVYAAGFHNVIASSGTAFTELQAKLLGRFSKKIVVNFDPDTAGARATERTLGTLVEEEFVIRVLTLEAGFDPDLFIRRKGKDNYGLALKNSQPYFDYLIERAQGQFPVRTPEGKVKAVNYLLPHIQRIPSRIVRDSLCTEIAQKLAIDSTVLRQELKHAAVNRSAAVVKSKAEVQVTDAEKILVRALSATRELPMEDQHISARDGVDEAFDPARQARFALEAERLHIGLPTESLLQALLDSPHSSDPLTLPIDDSARNLLAATLMNEAEVLSPELIEGAVRALRRTQLRRKLESVKLELTRRASSPDRMQALLEEKVRLKRALMDPAVPDSSSTGLAREF
ncbi:MAG TPA: DNA primase [Terriglobales bacterium]